MITTANIDTLPVEILEQIFYFIDHRTLINAALVCQKWRKIIDRISKHICETSVNPGIVEEIETIISSCSSQNQHYKPINCLENVELVFREDNRSLNALDLYSKSEIEYKISNDYVEILENVSVLTSILGLYFIICKSYNENTEIRILQINAKNNNEVELINSLVMDFDGIVTQICKFNYSVIFICSYNGITPVGLYKTGNQFPTVLSCNVKFDDLQNVQCDNDLILVQNSKDWGILYLYHVVNFSTTDIQLEYIHKFDFNQSLYQWNFYSSYLTTIESIGHCKMYKVNVSHKNKTDSTDSNSEIFEQTAKTAFIKDLRYPNPAYLVNNYVFVSTKTSASLLAYWHMDRGRGYWLVGSTLSNRKQIYINENSEIKVCKAFIGQKTQSVTCMFYSRGIMLCGTNDGMILLYHYKPSLLEETFLDLNRKPDLNFSAVKGPVKRLEAIFTIHGLLVAVKDRNTSVKIFQIKLKQ